MVEWSTLISRSGIRREKSREESLYSRYQRTETTMTSAREMASFEELVQA